MKCSNECQPKNSVVYVKDSCQLSHVLNNLGSCTTVKLCNGCYENVNLSVIEPILLKSLTLVGDTNILAGVSFVQGGHYYYTGLLSMPQISPNYGKGDNYNLEFDGQNKCITVTADVCNPNFSSVVSCTKVLLVDKNCIEHTFEVYKGCNNKLYLHETFDDTLFTENNGKEEVTVKGVSLTFIPSVKLNLSGTSIVSGVQNLKLVGLNINDGELHYGERFSNIENCLFGKDAVIYSNAMHATNRQPNTFMGKFTLNPQTSNKFVFNSVLLNGFIVCNNSNGTFSNSVFSMNFNPLKLHGANMNGEYNRFFHSKNVAILLDECSKLKTPYTLVCNAFRGIVALNSSQVLTEPKEDISESFVVFVDMINENCVKLGFHSFFYNWGGNPEHEIGATDSTSQYYWKQNIIV
jgi:hypothetical protein